MPRAKRVYKIDKDLDKIPDTNSVFGDKKVCLICLTGPLGRLNRVDTASIDGTEQSWCKKCYEQACELAEKYNYF